LRITLIWSLSSILLIQSTLIWLIVSPIQAFFWSSIDHIKAIHQSFSLVILGSVQSILICNPEVKMSDFVALIILEKLFFELMLILSNYFLSKCKKVVKDFHFQKLICPSENFFSNDQFAEGKSVSRKAFSSYLDNK